MGVGGRSGGGRGVCVCIVRPPARDEHGVRAMGQQGAGTAAGHNWMRALITTQKQGSRFRLRIRHATARYWPAF